MERAIRYIDYFKDYGKNKNYSRAKISWKPDGKTPITLKQNIGPNGKKLPSWISETRYELNYIRSLLCSNDYFGVNHL